MSAAALHVEDSGGSGSPVVLAHAIGCDRRMWDEVARHLEPRHRVLRLDARGHGQSPVPPRPYSLAAMAGDALGALDRLGIAKVHWVGLSMGGMIGQAFALAHGERLDRLVLANTTASYGPEGRSMWEARAKLVAEGGVATIAPTVEQRYFSEAFRREHGNVVSGVMQRFLATPAAGYLGCCDAIAELDFAARLPAIRHRTLVIAGEADAGTPVAMSEAMVARMPNARLAVIQGAAHLSAVEKPDEFARLVLDFLAAP